MKRTQAKEAMRTWVSDGMLYIDVLCVLYLIHALLLLSTVSILCIHQHFGSLRFTIIININAISNFVFQMHSLFLYDNYQYCLRRFCCLFCFISGIKDRLEAQRKEAEEKRFQDLQQKSITAQVSELETQLDISRKQTARAVAQENYALVCRSFTPSATNISVGVVGMKCYRSIDFGLT